jgi:inhibitor of KinA sporulation pathway (predicted exonuclease)
LQLCKPSDKFKIEKTMTQPYDYFLILDFEATCEENDRKFVNEIIEFPTVVLNSKTLQVETEFHKYVLPTVNKTLTNFCKTLTGIQQEWVENGEPSLKVCMEKYHQWLLDHNFIKNDTEYGAKSFLFITCGDWDLKTMIRSQCKREGIPLPFYFDRWCNLKHAYQDMFKEQAYGMSNMLEKLGLELKGKHHSGIDDCRNICQVAQHMIQKGAVLDITADTSTMNDDSFQITFIDIPQTSSSFAVSIKPPNKELEELSPKHKVTHYVSVLHPTKEGGRKYHNMVSQKLAGIVTHVDIPAKEKPLFKGEVSTDVFLELSKAVKGGNTRVLIHCNDAAPQKNNALSSTLFAYALLRHVTQLPRKECIELITNSRWRHTTQLENHSSDLNQADEFVAKL